MGNLLSKEEGKEDGDTATPSSSSNGDGQGPVDTGPGTSGVCSTSKDQDSSASAGEDRIGRASSTESDDQDGPTATKRLRTDQNIAAAQQSPSGVEPTPVNTSMAEAEQVERPDEADTTSCGGIVSGVPENLNMLAVDLVAADVRVIDMQSVTPASEIVAISVYGDVYVTGRSTPTVIYVFSVSNPLKRPGVMLTYRHHVGPSSIVGLKTTSSGTGRGPLSVVTYMPHCKPYTYRATWYSVNKQIALTFPLPGITGKVQSFAVDPRFDDLILVDDRLLLYIFDANGQALCSMYTGDGTKITGRSAVFPLPNTSDDNEYKLLLFDESASSQRVHLRRLGGPVIPIRISDIIKSAGLISIVDIPRLFGIDRFLEVRVVADGIMIQVVDDSAMPRSPPMFAACRPRIAYRIDGPEIVFDRETRRLLFSGTDELYSVDISSLNPYIFRR